MKNMFWTSSFLGLQNHIFAIVERFWPPTFITDGDGQVWKHLVLFSDPGLSLQD